MYGQLPNKEKKQRREKVRKQAILRSERELRKQQLTATQKGVDYIYLADTSSNISPSAASQSITTKSSKPNKGTVSSLQRTIRDLSIQR